MSLEPGQKIKPSFDDKDAMAFVQDKYSLRVKTVKEMNSYDDRNFLIITDDDARFTLKVSNSLDSSVPNLIGMLFKLIITNELINQSFPRDHE